MAGMPPQGSTSEMRQENPPRRTEENRVGRRRCRPPPAPEERRTETQWRRVPGLRAHSEAGQGGPQMRFILGIIIGGALTVGGAYVADRVSAAAAKPVMVNWDVVAKNFDSVTTRAREGWRTIAG